MNIIDISIFIIIGILLFSTAIYYFYTFVNNYNKKIMVKNNTESEIVVKEDVVINIEKDIIKNNKNNDKQIKEDCDNDVINSVDESCDDKKKINKFVLNIDNCDEYKNYHMLREFFKVIDEINKRGNIYILPPKFYEMKEDCTIEKLLSYGDEEFCVLFKKYYIKLDNYKDYYVRIFKNLNIEKHITYYRNNTIIEKKKLLEEYNEPRKDMFYYEDQVMKINK